MNGRRPAFTRYILNRQHPLAYGLQAFWLALPGLCYGTQWYDIAAFNTLTFFSLQAGFGFQPIYRPGGLANAAAFLDGNSAHTLRRVNSVPVSGVPMTLACWFLPSNALTQYGLLSIDSGGNANQAAIEVTSTGAVGAYINTGTGEVTSAATVTAGTWAFATGTFGNSNGPQLAYLNGTNKSSAGNVATIPLGVNTVRLGGNASATTKLAGYVDCGMVYNRVLSDAEVFNLYVETSLGCPNLLRHQRGPTVGYPATRAPLTMVPLDPSADPRSRHHSVVVASILNSLIRQGKLVQTGKEWILVP